MTATETGAKNTHNNGRFQWVIRGGLGGQRVLILVDIMDAANPEII